MIHKITIKRRTPSFIRRKTIEVTADNFYDAAQRVIGMYPDAEIVENVCKKNPKYSNVGKPCSKRFGKFEDQVMT